MRKKNRKKQTLAVVMASMLALATAAAAFPASVYAEEPRNTQAEGVAINETNFPDKVFRDYISEKFDKDGDQSLSAEEIETATYVWVVSMDITSLKGIEYLTNLKILYCDDTGITELDVSKNLSLETLSCDNTGITELDVSKNLSLEILSCGNIRITELDVSKNEALESLSCANTGITRLDVSKNPSLEWLACFNTGITGLDVSKNTELEHLNCIFTSLAYLNIGNNSNLTSYARPVNSTFIKTVGETFNITEMFEGIDPAKITITENGTLDPVTGIVSGYKTGDLTYTYDCGTSANGKMTLTVTLELTAPEPEKGGTTVTWNSDSFNKTYDKQPVSVTEKSYTVSGSRGDAAVTYQKKNTSGAWEDIKEAPVNAGTYRVRVTVEEDADYKSGTSEWKEFTISKAKPAYTVPEDLTAVEGNTLADVTLPGGFTWQDGDTASVGDAGNNTFKATYTPDDTENYETVTDIDIVIAVSHVMDSDWKTDDSRPDTDKATPDSDKPGADSQRNQVQTGDPVNVGAYVILISVSAACMSALAVWKKKKARKN